MLTIKQKRAGFTKLFIECAEYKAENRSRKISSTIVYPGGCCNTIDEVVYKKDDFPAGGIYVLQYIFTSIYHRNTQSGYYWSPASRLTSNDKDAEKRIIAFLFAAEMVKSGCFDYIIKTYQGKF